MKKPYIPIRVPICQCGARARVRCPRKVLKTREYREAFEMLGVEMHIPQNLMYCVECRNCNRRSAFANTKRAAVEKFEKAVEINVICG